MKILIVFEDLKCRFWLKMGGLVRAKTYQKHLFFYVTLIFSVFQTTLKNDAKMMPRNGADHLGGNDRGPSRMARGDIRGEGGVTLFILLY